MPPEDYISLILQEIRFRTPHIPAKSIHSIYFGGGTPSLLPSPLILSIIEELANQGFHILKNCEITIEINPGTVDKAKLKAYLIGGINRFSVGAQSFSDQRLKDCGREHRVDDTRLLLHLLKEYTKNFSVDLLFALPHQSLEGLKADLQEIHKIHPPHVSAYLLTIPTHHPMSMGRPPEGEQISMFQLIEDSLDKLGLFKYELSNFSKKNFESIHNQIYWSDENYWGLGLSAHSYMREKKIRFWNPKTWPEYIKYVKNPWKEPHRDYSEQLNEYEHGFDLVHTALRLSQGMDKKKFHQRLSNDVAHSICSRLDQLQSLGWVTSDETSWRLTAQGQILSNQVFSRLILTDT